MKPFELGKSRFWRMIGSTLFYLYLILCLTIPACDEKPPQSIEQGISSFQNKEYHYRLLANNRLGHLILFDQEMRFYEGTFAGTKLSFKSTERLRFSMKYYGHDTILIDGNYFQLNEGRVFLVTFLPEGTVIEQIPEHFHNSVKQNEQKLPQFNQEIERLKSTHSKVEAFFKK